MTGRISSSNKDGILVSLEFFNDVFIPSYLLQAPSEFNEKTSLWLWRYGEEESGDEFVMDIGEQVIQFYSHSHFFLLNSLTGVPLKRFSTTFTLLDLTSLRTVCYFSRDLLDE